MDADAVLTEEQRQFRFRKVIERKNKRSKMSLDGEAVSPARSTLCPPLTSEQQQQQQQQQQQHHHQQQQQQQQQYDISMENWADSFQSRVEMIVQNYQMLKLNYTLSDKLFAKLDSFGNEDLNSKIDTNELLSYIIGMSEEFRHFANLHR